MSATVPFTVASPQSFGGKIRGLMGLPDADKYPGQRPAVVVCHGFKGFMEWGFFGPLADLLTARGFVTCRFNYSGTGMAPGDELVTDLDAFRRNTFSLERDETLRVLDAVEGLGDGNVDEGRIGLVGHSRGGAAAILGAASEAWRGRLGALVTWASISTFERYAQHHEVWRRDGVLPVKNGRTGQELELGLELLDDLTSNRKALDLKAAAGRITAPWLIVHGANDDVVPVEEAAQLASWTSAPHQVERIADGDHTFGARHPFVGPTAELTRALNATQLWLRRHLA